LAVFVSCTERDAVPGARPRRCSGVVRGMVRAPVVWAVLQGFAAPGQCFRGRRRNLSRNSWLGWCVTGLAEGPLRLEWTESVM
jgi:hypothetical protein